MDPFYQKYSTHLAAIERLAEEFLPLKDRLTWDSSPEAHCKHSALKKRIKAIVITMPQDELWAWCNSGDEDDEGDWWKTL